ncbi:DNA-directed RNA polymerase subunit delta [Salinicoccus jeotgali]|uniref:Probable DNA-directed RNA polymerase subunit delta n=1 Tax=Salinicoccus jeotgali TaxID=381634 RepID=A0ABP7E9C6_9STAP
MRLDDYSKQMLDENSFIEMAHIYLEDVGKEVNLYDIVDKFKELGGYSDKEIENRIVQFYTDLNTDGRFLSTGEGLWGLRDWYSVDDISDKIAPTIHKIELAVEDEPIEEDIIDQDKELVEDDTEDLDSPLSKNEISGKEEVDETIDEDIEYDDTDELEDSYEDKPDL